MGLKQPAGRLLTINCKYMVNAFGHLLYSFMAIACQYSHRIHFGNQKYGLVISVHIRVASDCDNHQQRWVGYHNSFRFTFILWVHDPNWILSTTKKLEIIGIFFIIPNRRIIYYSLKTNHSICLGLSDWLVSNSQCFTFRLDDPSHIIPLFVYRARDFWLCETAIRMILLNVFSNETFCKLQTLSPCRNLNTSCCRAIKQQVFRSSVRIAQHVGSNKDSIPQV